MYGFDIWTIIFLIFAIPIALNVALLVVLGLIKIVRNIYIHVRYGLDYTDQDG